MQHRFAAHDVDSMHSSTDQNQRQHRSKHSSHAKPTRFGQSVLNEDSFTAADYKTAGNKLCTLHRYEEAVVYYGKAIAKSPEVAIFFSNRALCYLKLRQWQLAIQDCRRALELDANLVKAQFFLGQALAETGNYDDSLKHLQRAHDLAKENKLNFGDDIAYQIRLIKRHKLNKVEDDSTKLEIELRNYLIDLIERDREYRLSQIKNNKTNLTNQTKQQQQHHQQQLNHQDETIAITHASPQQANEAARSSQDRASVELEHAIEQHSQVAQEQQVKSKCDNFIQKLDQMFDNLKLQRKKRDIPEYLCGKISFEIMHDPVITPSGITYDRPDIEEHLRRVGHFDPITRKPLKSTDLISNLAMKEVVDAYMNENEWALYY